MSDYKYKIIFSNNEKNEIIKLINAERNRRLKAGLSDVHLLNSLLEKMSVAEPKKVGGLFK